MSSDLKFSVIDLAILRLETLSDRAQQFMDKKLVDNAIRDILDPFKSILTSRGVSQRFIDAIEIRKIGFMKIAIVIKEFKTADGRPLNIMLEYGWSEFWVEPVYAKSLHWTDFGGDFFSMGHMIRGFRGYHTISSLNNWGFVDIFVQRLVIETSQYLEEVSFK